MSEWNEERFNKFEEEVESLKGRLAYIANELRDAKGDNCYLDRFSDELTYSFDSGSVTVEEGESNSDYRWEAFSPVYIYRDDLLNQELNRIKEAERQKSLKAIEARKRAKEEEDRKNEIMGYRAFKELYPKYHERYEEELQKELDDCLKEAQNKYIMDTYTRITQPTQVVMGDINNNSYKKETSDGN